MPGKILCPLSLTMLMLQYILYLVTAISVNQPDSDWLCDLSPVIDWLELITN